MVTVRFLLSRLSKTNRPDHKGPPILLRRLPDFSGDDVSLCPVVSFGFATLATDLMISSSHRLRLLILHFQQRRFWSFCAGPFDAPAFRGLLELRALFPFPTPSLGASASWIVWRLATGLESGRSSAITSDLLHRSYNSEHP